MSIDSEFEGLEALTETADEVSVYDAPDITPEEYAEHLANLVANALVSTKMFGIVEIQAGIGQIHIMGRVRRDAERKFLEQVVGPILSFFDKNEECHGFVGKQFVLKDEDVKYAWVVSFASNDLKKTASDLCMTFDTAIPRVEVTESPLLGPTTPQSGGRVSGRRGASPVM